MHISHQKERFSIAYVRALAAQAACYCDEPEVDDDSVDLRVYAKLDCGVETNRPEMALQLKCTATPDFREDGLHFDLPVKNYNDLRANSLYPRYLVVICLPEKMEQWLIQTEEELCLRKCGYWLSLEGYSDVSNKKSVQVVVPRSQIFSVEFLKKTLKAVANGEEL